MDWHCRHANSGATALEFVGTQDFDLVSLDLIMPEMSGFEVLRRSRRQKGDIGGCPAHVCFGPMNGH
jgi:CheY-like chemotaxis protein